MTTKREWTIGIVGGLILVVILITLPPWMVIPVLAGIYIAYKAIDGWERGKTIKEVPPT